MVIAQVVAYIFLLLIISIFSTTYFGNKQL